MKRSVLRDAIHVEEVDRDIRTGDVMPAAARIRWGAITILPVWDWLFWLSGPLLALIVTAQLFPYRRLIAGGDNFPTDFFNPANWLRRAPYVWDLTGVGGPNSPAVLLPVIVVSRLLRVFLSPGDTQHAVYALLIAGQFLVMQLLVLTLFPGRRVAAFFAGLFYCLNTYSMLGIATWFTTYILFYLPLMAVLVIRSITGAPSRLRLLLFALSSASSGILFVNPPIYAIFLLFACIVLAYVLTTYRRAAGVWRRVALLIVLFLVANAYWMAQAYFLLFGAGHSQISASTNPADVSGVARRSSILNLFWLNPTWAWDFYFPYAPLYKTPLLLGTIFLPTLLTFSSLFNKALPRRVVLPTLSLVLILLLISTGQHGPWQSVDLLLYRHVPLFWLFREPDSKFPFVLLVLYAPLVGCQVEWLANGAVHMLRKWRLYAVGAKAGIMAVVGAALLIAAFPFVTGAAVGRGQISPDKIGMDVPNYWFQLGSYLSQHDPHDGVLLLPNDDFYQMPYTWGYYGVDAIASEFLPNRTIVLSGGQGYLSASSSYEDFKAKILRGLIDNSHLSLTPYLAALGIKYIVQRNDIEASAPTRHIVSQQQVRRYLHAQRAVHFVRSFGQLDLYVVDRQHYVPPVYAVSLVRDVMSHSNWQQQVHQEALASLGFFDNGLNQGRQSRAPSPHILRPAWSQQSPTRLSVHLDLATGPVLLVFSTLYNSNWHACVVPDGQPVLPWTCWFGGFLPARQHVPALNLTNGWLINRSGRYTVIIDYGTQHLADIASLLSLVSIGVLVVAVLSSWILRTVQIIPPVVRRYSGSRS